MKNKKLSRSEFIKNVTMTGAAIGMVPGLSSLFNKTIPPANKRVGIIGLDTSHSISFTKLLNAETPSPEFDGYKVVAAYPYGSRDIKSAADVIPRFTEAIKKYNVEIVDSIEQLLQKSDAVLLLTNDGRLHLEQVTQVFKAGKPVYINKPVAATLKDTIEIFKRAKEYKVPAFSSSALRYVTNLQEIAKGKFGKVLGADTYSPATIEKTHPDLVWYGIHGVESLFTAMGTGCKEVMRMHTDGTDIAVGKWEDGRLGSVRGTRTGEHIYGGTVFIEKGAVTLGEHEGYTNILKVIVEFFNTGISPVNTQETLEIMAFMEAADLSKKKGGRAVKLETIFKKAEKRS